MMFLDVVPVSFINFKHISQLVFEQDLGLQLPIIISLIIASKALNSDWKLTLITMEKMQSLPQTKCRLQSLIL